MPRVTVEWLAIRSEAQRREVAKKITSAVAETVAVAPDAVTVVFREVDPDHQSKGGVFWSERLDSEA